MILGEIQVEKFLQRTQGRVRGQIVTDAKNRYYAADYKWKRDSDSPGHLLVSRSGGTGDEVQVRAGIELDESLVSLFGLYSGDGAKGSEDPNNIGKIKPHISFSQREPQLVKFAIAQFRRLFPGSIRFTFSIGEDSALFMVGERYELLREYYGGKIPDAPTLGIIQPNLSHADRSYLEEKRPNQESPEKDLAFYHFHKPAMEDILKAVKVKELERTGTILGPDDRVAASLRRPFKKGARERGGSSRSDETHVGGVNGFGELFLKMLHELEGSILDDAQTSSQGLIRWNDVPSRVGKVIDIKDFFESNSYGQIGGERPTIEVQSPATLMGRWRRNASIIIRSILKVDPLWCYTSGLYLAEGSTSKSTLFSMFRERPKSLALGFTSSENTSLELILRALQRLFQPQDCLTAWKIKVGSQYFPELVVIGLKNAVPMLRGGQSGDGKLRTMEISIAVKDWGLGVAPALKPFADRYSHVEPTGAGVPRVDFWASSTLCRWYFPLVMYATFGNIVTDPGREFSL
jgi:hypothetical protein